MQHVFALLLAICALASALPPNKGSVESELEESKRLKLCTSRSSRLKVSSEITSSSSEEEDSQSHVITIKDAADLAARLSEAGDKLVVIFIMEEWCYYSRMIVPDVEEIANRKEDVVVLKVVREDINTGDKWQYGVGDYHRIPTFMFVRNGEKVKQFTGANSALLRRFTSRFTTRSTTTSTTTTTVTTKTTTASMATESV